MLPFQFSILTRIRTDRSNGFPTIIFTNDTNPSSAQNCSKLILAFPPIIKALKAANLDISPDETTVFSPVGTTKYWSGAVSVKIPAKTPFAAFIRETFFGLIEDFIGKNIFPIGNFIPWLPEAAGEPVALLRLFDQSDVATTYSWGKYRGNQTIDQARVLLKQVISKINKDPRDTSAKSTSLVDGDIKDFREWDYFPHFDKAQLDQGFYEKFNSLQGRKNTYYASGLNGFETIEFVIRAGQDVVDSYFTEPPNGTATAPPSIDATGFPTNNPSGATSPGVKVPATSFQWVAGCIFSIWLLAQL